MITRRQFLTTTTTAAVVSAATHAFAAANDGEIKVAIVGCGGQGVSHLGKQTRSLQTTPNFF